MWSDTSSDERLLSASVQSIEALCADGALCAFRECDGGLEDCVGGWERVRLGRGDGDVLGGEEDG